MHDRTQVSNARRNPAMETRLQGTLKCLYKVLTSSGDTPLSAVYCSYLCVAYGEARDQARVLEYVHGMQRELAQTGSDLSAQDMWYLGRGYVALQQVGCDDEAKAIADPIWATIQDRYLCQLQTLLGQTDKDPVAASVPGPSGGGVDVEQLAIIAWAIGYMAQYKALVQDNEACTQCLQAGYILERALILRGREVDALWSRACMVTAARYLGHVPVALSIYPASPLSMAHDINADFPHWATALLAMYNQFLAQGTRGGEGCEDIPALVPVDTEGEHAEAIDGCLGNIVLYCNAEHVL